MIFNKAILSGAIEIAEEDYPVLLDVDGSVAAMNRWALYAASPTTPSVRSALPFPGDSPLREPAAFPRATIEKLARAIPADKQFKGMLEHASVARKEGNVYEATMHDGSGPRVIPLRAARPPESLLSWRDRFKALGAPSASLGKHVYNRARLSSVVAAIEASCRHSGEFAYVGQEPFANGYVWRASNELTGQVIVVAWVLPGVGSAPERGEWERELFKVGRAAALVRPTGRVLQ